MSESTDSAGSDEGRYLYCVVDVGGNGAVETGTPLDAEGVDGEAPYLVVQGDIAAVVQRRATPYDSDDQTTVKRWLLQHQGVVDAANERFGTPLPVRFDTIVEGDDDGIGTWLDDQASALRPALDRFEGRDEYRVEVTCDADQFATGVTAADERLDELEAEKEQADSGTAFMKGKQAERRERAVVREEWEETISTLRESLTQTAASVKELDQPVSTLEEGGGSGDDFVTTFAFLADEAAAATIGERLDDVASAPGVEVRYTGPWPPYTFAPTLESEQ